MKKTLFLFVAILFLLTGCTKDEELKEEKLSEFIIGNWTSNKLDLPDSKGTKAYTYEFDIQFYSDGKYDLDVIFGDEKNSYYSKAGYAYEVNDLTNQITLMYPDPDKTQIVSSGDPIMFEVSIKDSDMSWERITVLDSTRVMTKLLKPVIIWKYQKTK